MNYDNFEEVERIKRLRVIGGLKIKKIIEMIISRIKMIRRKMLKIRMIRKW